MKEENKKWFIVRCGSGKTIFANEVEYVGETKTQLKFKRKSGTIVKARKEEKYIDIKNCHQMLGECNEFSTIQLLDIEITKSENYITSFL